MFKKLITLLLLTSAIYAQHSPERQKFPVVLTGAEVPSLVGKDITKIFGYKYENNTWTQVPFQVDERTWVDFSTKRQPGEEYRYLPGDGLLDGNDELVFMLSDMGSQAPSDNWVVGADPERVEIKTTDPIDNTVSYLYIYTGNLSNYAQDYVSYNRTVTGQYTENTLVSSPFYQARYVGNWIWDYLSINNNTDMIDRLKYRVYGRTQAEGKGFNETEEYWSYGRSTYIGDKDGPVRVIRMVEGAASGPTTTYHAKWYKEVVNVEVNYRVHGIPNLWAYFDYKTNIPMSVYNVTGGGQALMKSWAQGSSSLGSILTWFDMSELAANAKISEKYYLNDLGFDDETGEDGSAYQNMGIHLYNIENLEGSKATQIRQWSIFLPENAPSQGNTYDQIISNPVTVTKTLQQSGGGYVDTEPPTVYVNAPVSGDSFYLGDTVQVLFTAQDNVGVDSIFVSFNNQEQLASLNGTATSHLWIADTVGQDLFFRVSARDSSGNTGFDDSGYFTVQDTAVTPPPPQNQPPVAIAASDVSSGDEPLTVNFDGTASYDPDGTITSYQWDFGDGNSASGSLVTHTYTTSGIYRPILTVVDDSSSSGTDTLTITVNAVTTNTRPSATILEPQDGAVGTVNQAMYYSGSGTDQEDGNLPESAYTWTVRGPDGNIYPVAQGQSSGYATPTYPGNYVLFLEVQDSGGLTDKDSVNVTVNGGTAKIGFQLYQYKDRVEVVTNAPKDSNIEINIYDLLGRKIDTLYRGNIFGNARFIKMKSALPNGIYFAVMRTLGQREIKKFTVVK